MKKIMPIYDDGFIPVVFATSREYLKFLSVTIKSLIMARRARYQLDIIVLISSSNCMKSIDRFVNEFADENVSIRFFEIDQLISEHYFCVREGYSNESFYRVFISEIMPEYKKVIYLDSDIIVCEDILNLFNVDCEESKCVAAVRDINGISASYINYENRKNYIIDILKLKDISDYFQSGVMIFNIQSIKNNHNFNEFVVESSSKKIMFGDQDVLNKIYSGSVSYLNMKWNLIVNVDRVKFENQYLLAPVDLIEEYLEARNKPGIVHFAGSKPWKDADCDFSELYWNIARLSPFYNKILRGE